MNKLSECSALVAGAALLLSVAGCSKSGSSAQSDPSATTPASATAAGSATVAAGSVNTTATGAGANLKVGDMAPDFTAKSQDGKEVHLSAMRGKPVVVYFYPKDETPGCTKQACGFRDAWNDLDKKGVQLVGVSADSDESHKKFIEHYKLPFVLVSDSDGKLASLFGVPFRGGMTMRQTIVIDAEGKIKKIYREVDVATHAKDVLNDLS